MAVFLLIFAVILSMNVVAAIKIASPPIIVHGNDRETCPSTEQQNIALEKMKDNVYQYLSNASILPQCGEGIWYQVAYLNMTGLPQAQN